MKTGSSPFGRTKNRGTVKSTPDSRLNWMKNGGHVIGYCAGPNPFDTMDAQSRLLLFR